MAVKLKKTSTAISRTLSQVEADKVKVSNGIRLNISIAVRGLQLIVGGIVLGIVVGLFVSVPQSVALRFTVSTNGISVLYTAITLIPFFAKKVEPYYFLVFELANFIFWVLCTGYASQIYGAGQCSTQSRLFAKIGTANVDDSTLNVCNVAKTILGGSACNLIMFATSLSLHVCFILRPAITRASGEFPKTFVEFLKSAFEYYSPEKSEGLNPGALFPIVAASDSKPS